VILLLQGRGWDDHFRFLQNGEKWQFAGHVRAYLKNHPRRPEIPHVGDRPFLTISMQGISGTGIDGEFQQWFDLSQPYLNPVFGFTVQGEEYGSAITRTVRSDAWAGRVGRADMITLTTRIDFSIEETHLDTVQYTATYQREPGERKFSLKTVDSGGKTIRAKEFYAISNIQEDPLPCQQVLIYAMPSLAKVASGTDSSAKEALRSYLELCKEDTPATKALLDLLAKP
jgi:hypothetical protein